MEVRQPIAVVVRVLDRKGVPVHRSIHRFAEDMHIRAFREMVPKIYPTAETYLINVRNATEPDPKKNPLKGQLWCPYCVDYRHYLKDGDVGTDRCEICGISTNDFHVKGMNKLWPSLREVAEQARKSKKGGEKK